MLIATTRLSITTPITGWNEPGEALKLLVEDEQPPTEALLAHEYAHFVLFDLAGTTRGEWPWWVSEGASQYAASRFWTLTDRNRVLATVNEARRTTGLPDWLAISSFEETPESQWHYAYELGYAFLRFVAETHGRGGPHRLAARHGDRRPGDGHPGRAGHVLRGRQHRLPRLAGRSAGGELGERSPGEQSPRGKRPESRKSVEAASAEASRRQPRGLSA